MSEKERVCTIFFQNGFAGALWPRYWERQIQYQVDVPMSEKFMHTSTWYNHYIVYVCLGRPHTQRKRNWGQSQCRCLGWQWHQCHSVKKKILRIFGPEIIRIYELIKTARSTVTKNRAKRSSVFWKSQNSSSSERAFSVFFGHFFGCSTPSNKWCFNTQEFSRFLSTVLSKRRATRSDVWTYKEHVERARDKVCVRFFFQMVLQGPLGQGTERSMFSIKWYPYLSKIHAHVHSA